MFFFMKAFTTNIKLSIISLTKEYSIGKGAINRKWIFHVEGSFFILKGVLIYECCTADT